MRKGSRSFNGTLVVGVMLSAVLGTTGCKNILAKLKKKGDAGVTATGASGVTGQDDADELLQEKLGEYIKCLNTLSSPIHQSRHRYYTYVPKSGPTGREGYADLYRLPTGATAKCSAGVSTSKTMPPSDPKLESSGEEFAASAAAIDQLIIEADRYYENKDFKDDKWAKGKELHPRLVAAWDRFSKADKDLHDTLDGITKPLSQRVLARIEREEGKKFRYFRKSVLITAREMVEASDPVGEDDDIDFNLYGAAYTNFEKAIDDLEAFGSLHKSELSNQKLAPSWPMADSNYESFVKESNDFKKSSKEFWRCLRDAPDKAKTPSGKIDPDKLGYCSGMPAWKRADQVVKDYNEFIRTSNTHPFP